MFSVWASAIGTQFFSGSTLRNILDNMVFAAFLTIGAGSLMLAGHMDLSSSTIGAMCGIVTAWCITHGVSWILAIIISLVLGAAFGAFNSFIVTRFHFPSFIATLVMSSVVRGLLYFFSSLGTADGQAANINFLNKPLDTIGNGRIGGIPISIIIMLIIYIIFAVIMAKTRYGTKVKMLGGNPVAANLAGIKSTGITYLLFITSGAMAAVAGVIYAGKMQQGNLLALTSSQFTGLTAAILGGISFGGGEGGLGGAFVGMLVLNTFTIGMSVCRVDNNVSTIFNGLLLIVALALDFFRQARKRKV